MSFKAWEEVDHNRLVLPIGGKDYTIPPVGYLDEIRIREANAPRPDGEDPPPGIPDVEFLAMVLGSALQQMREDNVPRTAILHAAATAHTFTTHGLAIAREVWENGLDPEALAASLKAAQGKPASSKASTPSPSTESESPTPSVSTTTTTSRKATPRSPAKKPASRSSGKRSSPSAS